VPDVWVSGIFLLLQVIEETQKGPHLLQRLRQLVYNKKSVVTSMRKASIKNNVLSSKSLLLPAIFLYFLLLTFFLKTIFILKNWTFLKPDGFGELLWALFVGMRFDISILAYFLSLLFLSYLLVLKRTRLTEWIFEIFVPSPFYPGFGLQTFSILKRPGNILRMRPLPISGLCFRLLFPGPSAAPCFPAVALQPCFSL
jgi:hypothetical protein